MPPSCAQFLGLVPGVSNAADAPAAEVAEPYTRNPIPENRDPKPKPDTRNPKPKPETRSPEPEIPNPKT